MNKYHFYTAVTLLLFLTIGIQPVYAQITLSSSGWSDQTVGDWDPDTQTATLTTDVSVPIIISNPWSGGPDLDPITLIGGKKTTGENAEISGVTGFQEAAVELNGSGFVNIQDLTIIDCDTGINLIDSVVINVTNNSVTNCQYGIRLIGARTCTIEGNVVSGNDSPVNGIELGTITVGTKKRDSIGNNLYNNTIEKYGFGIYIWGLGATTATNQISNNNFIDNSVANAQVLYTSDATVSIFHHNYWDDYTGVDNDGDGIGDTPYIIRADGNPSLVIKDDYPWIVENGWNDTDGDGLTDYDEINIYGTNPNNPDSDGDGLWDGTEVEMAAGSGCPNPLNPDSDGDTLTDGAEVEVEMGTNPCNVDTDGDVVPDNMDPEPLEPGDTQDIIEELLREDAVTILDILLEDFSGPNNNANKGRRGALSNRATEAANQVADANYQEAIDILFSILDRVDGEETPKDWMSEGTDGKNWLEAEMMAMIDLLGYLL